MDRPEGRESWAVPAKLSNNAQELVMRKQTLWIALVGAAMFAGLLGATEVNGQNDREFDEQIHKLQQQVKELVESGRNDDAAHVKQEIGRLQEQSHRRLDKERGNHPDSGDAKQQLAELEHRLAELKEQGRGDEAARVARQIDEIRQHLEHNAHEGSDQPKHTPNRGLEERLAKMKQRIAELKEVGRHDEAERLGREAREMMHRAQEPEGGDASWRGEMLDERIGHIREAAKHLHAAGLNDVADNLMQQAERMAAAERVARQDSETRRDDGPQLGRQVEELSRALRDMHQQMERMEKQMQEMNERSEKRK
jgi:hypothetical protein